MSNPTDTPRKRSVSFGWNPGFKPLVGVVGSPPTAALPFARDRSDSQGSAIEDGPSLDTMPNNTMANRFRRTSMMSRMGSNRALTADEERILKGEFLF